MQWKKNMHIILQSTFVFIAKILIRIHFSLSPFSSCNVLKWFSFFFYLIFCCCFYFNWKLYFLQDSLERKQIRFFQLNWKIQSNQRFSFSFVRLLNRVIRQLFIYIRKVKHCYWWRHKLSSAFFFFFFRYDNMIYWTINKNQIEIDDFSQWLFVYRLHNCI